MNEEKTDSHQITKTEAFWVNVMRMNRAIGIDRFRRTFHIGRLKFVFEWRSGRNTMGRFGGGWNWKFGFQAGGSTIQFSFLVCTLSISVENQ